MAIWRDRPQQATDDGYYTDSWKTSPTQLLNGDYFGDDADIAIRYPNVTIPQGSTINSATMGFTMDVAGFADDDTNLRVRGIDQDDVSTFSSSPLGLSQTSAYVDWALDGPFDNGDEASPPDIKNIIQEIVDRGGWESGNAIGIVVLENGSDSDTFIGWAAYGNGDWNSPELVINYTAPPTTTTTSTSTSSSTTTTNTSSSTSTTTPPIDPQYAQGIVRVTKEGKDVIDSNFLDDFFLDSKYAMLKIHDYGTFSTNILGVKEIEHNLGYIPYVVVFSQYLEDDGGGGVNISDEYYQHDWYLYGAAYYSTGYTKVYDDKIVITIENINTPTPGVLNGFYYIFKEEVS